MAFSKITTRGMSGDTLEAGDIAANAIGASELADNAVDAGAIASGAVTAAKVADGLIEVKPHIKPGTLYPAWSGLIDNHTGHTFTDSSTSARTITTSGDVHHTGALKKIGSTSMKFSGTGKLQMADHADWETEEADFTLEFWINFTTGNVHHTIWDYGYTASGGFLIQTDSDATTPKMRIHSDGNAAQVETSGASLNTWHHYAIVRVSNVHKIYRNGVETFSGSCSGHDIDGAHGLDAYIGAKSDGNYATFGYIDDFRFTKGLAVYTGAFTPQTTALTTTWSAGTNIAANSTASNVKLLLHSEATGAHSGAYGTAQSDGKKYYYTDIKGSKPIKDPRIGGHFGSQRHKFKSLQLLEQETATHGSEVYSVDGREWVRIKGNAQVFYGDHGHFIQSNEAGSVTPNFFVEIVGYFNDFNVISRTHPTRVDDINVTVNGTTTNSGDTDKLGGKAVANSPLRNRFVDSGSVINHDDSTVATNLGTTPKINTIKLEAINTGSEYWDLFGCELIAQDTTSTANKSKIQIPSQNVVSYGKKFTVSGTPHYDPFNGFTSGTDISGYIDEATSLGMSNWKVSSTWYRPFNGGRVVKWVDSSGTIKTSVTMMPPNAQNIGGTASNAIDLSSSQTNDDTINFNTSGIDHSLSEVAKQYYWSEFGNGSANASDGGSWKDWSMNNASSHERAYVMDDGLTSLLSDHAVFGTNAENDVLGCRIAVDTGVQNTYFTFIGTGISAELKEWDSGAKFNAVGFQTLAQNLPYGTHIIKIARDNTGTDQVTLLVDGVSAQVEAFNVDHNALETLRFMAFHQPKKPPIPEDAVVLADYCLFADYVATSTGAVPNISKGVRRISSSRDIFYDASSGTPALAIDINKNMGFQMTAGSTPSADVFQGNLPAFATIMEANGYGDRRQIYVDGGSAEAQTVVGSSYGTCTKMNSAKTLGLYTFKSKNKASTDGDLDAIDVATPIHTSSHYQTFETPFLKELVGGDRNMEQHNLIVTPDGKSWDEVTRDTSYIGNVKMRTNLGNEQSITNPLIWTEWRGKASGGDIDGIDKFNKDFAITRDRGVICLVPGNYQITWWVYINMDDAAGGYTIYVNGTIITQNYSATPASGKTNSLTIVASPYLYRGDYITMGGTSAISQQNFEIIKV